ncbi:hypothetical protein CCAX7_008060 [Capsulimonas corticalis]|uniref:Uncharacterized protein n=1 Tax=Capsulimonas corticalis TaxID=2219043 RepID=A0A402CTX0_9BACT|nr:hypothetical protein [Capsulimonas corticalis]BDI28755.1 hypothetical protein CCAX7_008060 [Capsulimonas corticalis]
MTDSYEEEAPSSDEPYEGIVSLRYLGASVALALTFAIIARLGFILIGSNVFAFIGIWLIGQLILTVRGIALGVRGVRSWRGKCGLYGSILMVAIVIFMAWIIVGVMVNI